MKQLRKKTNDKIDERSKSSFITDTADVWKHGLSVDSSANTESSKVGK